LLLEIKLKPKLSAKVSILKDGRELLGFFIGVA